MPSFAAERQIARHQGLTASVDSNFGCAPSASVTVRAPEASAYTGDRVDLQRLLGTVRAGLGADCPILNELDVTGFAGGDPVFQAAITADDGWRLPTGVGRILAENPLPPLASETAKCDHEWSDPFVGCWIGVDPARGRGSILNIRKDGTWYWDTPEKLALGQPVFDGKKIERSYMYLAGPFLTFVQKQGGFFDLVGPYFAAECNVMKLNPYQPFGGSDEPQIFIRLRSPLKINADLLKDSAWETTGIGNPGNDEIIESMPDEGPSFTNCVDNFNQDIIDGMMLDAALLVIPAFRFPLILSEKYIYRASRVVLRFPTKYKDLLIYLRGSLSFHEKAGGHLIANHVGKSEADLLSRLLSSKISAASSFKSIVEAEKAVTSVFKQEAGKIATWIESGAVGRLVIEGQFDGGLVLTRGAAASQQGTMVRIILQGNGQKGYYILTGYPIP